MPQTAHADPHEHPAMTAAAVPALHEASNFRKNFLGTSPVGAGFHSPSASVLSLVAPLRTRCWKSPRAGPRVAPHSGGPEGAGTFFDVFGEHG